MAKVNDVKLRQVIQTFPHTFYKETFLNTPLEDHVVQIQQEIFAHGNYYSVIITKDGAHMYGSNNITLRECIQYIQRRCITKEELIKMERDLLFDTPIEA
jgi:hypothetical protein